MSGKRFYTKGNWYMDNYTSLGSDWLINSLTYLRKKRIIGTEYILVSPSANLGYYEADAFEHESKKGYHPEYYLGDKLGKDLEKKVKKRIKKDEINPFDFQYIYINSDASDFIFKCIKNKTNIVLDTKGALWYALLGGEPKNNKLKRYDLQDYKCTILRLLKNYINLLKDDGILLVDYYKRDDRMIPKMRKKWKKCHIKKPSLNEHSKEFI